MRRVVLLLVIGVVFILGLKWAVNVTPPPPNKELIQVMEMMAIKALEEIATKIEKEDITPKELAEIADNARIRAATLRVNLAEIGK